MELSITLIIIILTAAISIGAFSNDKLYDRFIFYPPAITHNKQWYRFFSSGLLHADWMHLIFNMLTLYLFGVRVEQQFGEIFGESGRILYLLMYVSALLVALLPTYLKHKEDAYYRGLGASGAVSAVLFAGLLIAPYTEVYLMFIPIPIPGFIFAPLYLLLSAYMNRRGGDNINHSAHIWGAIYGIAFVVVLGFALAGFNAIEYCIQGIKYYLTAKGWI